MGTTNFYELYPNFVVIEYEFNRIQREGADSKSYIQRELIALATRCLPDDDSEESFDDIVLFLICLIGAEFHFGDIKEYVIEFIEYQVGIAKYAELCATAGAWCERYELW